jgi:hypothetical protein
MNGDGVRRAALALHALVPADRAWLLERLPAQQRAHVQALLSELADLGIPKDRTLVDDIVAKQSTPASKARPDAAALAKALEGEPASLVALALKTHDEAARAAVPRALREALLAEVAPRLAAANEPVVPAVQSWRRRIAGVFA